MASGNIIIVCCLLCLAFIPAHYLRRRRLLPLPPSPKKLPLIGNLLDVSSHCQWEVYAQWAKDLDSDIIHLDIAGTSMIILSSVAAAKDLLDRRSAIYSDRPRFAMHALVAGDIFFGFAPYGNSRSWYFIANETNPRRYLACPPSPLPSDT